MESLATLCTVSFKKLNSFIMNKFPSSIKIHWDILSFKSQLEVISTHGVFLQAWKSSTLMEYLLGTQQSARYLHILFYLITSSIRWKNITKPIE